MMSRLYGVAFILVTLVIAGSLQAGDSGKHEGKNGALYQKMPLLPGTMLYSPNAYKIPYLGIDGIFTLDPAEAVPYSDPRNPKRIVFEMMEYFSFYQDEAGQEPLAEGCRYIYKGAAGDPYYFYKADPPAKTSIWDLFELADGEEACNDFYYVTVRAPHGDPVHMHLRYGNERSSFSKLLRNSTGPEDTTALDPWWSVYCAEGVTGCD